MKLGVILMLAAMMSSNADPASAEATPLAPYIAEYDVKYGNYSVGTSRTELRRSSAPDAWQIESRTTARGLARLIAGGTLVQSSIFQLEADALRPHSYRFDDGTKRSDRDIALDFDWVAGRVSGTAEGKAVDIESESGLQDAASMQACVQWRLNRGIEPGVIAMIEKDRVKYYHYTLLRRERLTTAIGEFDTLVYRSAREGKSRETLLWYAPALGNVTVQAEQRQDGKRLFQTYIRVYRVGGV
ncbi:MAG: DUF3108 domain-containing protein [Steroidobacteraceae bacterium]